MWRSSQLKAHTLSTEPRGIELYSTDSGLVKSISLAFPPLASIYSHVS